MGTASCPQCGIGLAGPGVRATCSAFSQERSPKGGWMAQPESPGRTLVKGFILRLLRGTRLRPFSCPTSGTSETGLGLCEARGEVFGTHLNFCITLIFTALWPPAGAPREGMRGEQPGHLGWVVGRSVPFPLFSAINVCHFSGTS